MQIVISHNADKEFTFKNVFYEKTGKIRQAKVR